MILKPTNLIQDKIIGEGGESVIYEISDSLVAKIYKPCVNLIEKEKKIGILKNKNLPRNVVAPKELIYDASDRFIGYLMDRVSGEEIKRLSNRKFCKINNIDTRGVLEILISIKDTLKKLHTSGVYISDLNECNILFRLSNTYYTENHIHFIDVDSWTVDDLKGTVCMDSFRDPLLISNNFNEYTDNYAFAVMAFKCLTRLHPFGGTVTPDMNLLDRMRSKLSVLDGRVSIPRSVESWDTLSPELISKFRQIFEANDRTLIDVELDELYQHLKMCRNHHNYYFDKYTSCPVCDKNAKILSAPEKLTSSSGLNSVLFINHNYTKLIIDQYTIITNKNLVNCVYHLPSKMEHVLDNKCRKVMFSNDGETMFELMDDTLLITTLIKDGDFDCNRNFRGSINNLHGSITRPIAIQNKSDIIVRDKTVYYKKNNALMCSTNINSKGSNISKVCDTSFNAYFNVSDDCSSYIVVNVYDQNIIVNIDKTMFNFKSNKTIQEYGLHYDQASKSWLMILEFSDGTFMTKVFNKIVQYEDTTIKWSGNLANYCFYNNTIFKTVDGAIRGFNYSKNLYKDFECDVVEDDMKISRKDKGFIVLGDTKGYIIN